MRDGVITHYLYDAISPEDVKKYGRKVGCDKGQQTWEALGMLVSLRCWQHVWADARSCLTLQGDSLTALFMAASTHSKSDINVHIARELAMLLGNASYRPDVIEHIPGLSNIIPDFLSRIYEPGKTATPWPALLAEAQRTPVPTRGTSWYLAAAAPRRASRIRA